MAYVARLSDVNDGGVLLETLQEGSPVGKTSNPGTTRTDLPGLVKAIAGKTKNVYVLIKGPDDFSRPTDERMYTAPTTIVRDPNHGFAVPILTTTMYQVGKSTLWNPTLVSGELVTAQRGGSYAVPSGTFVDGDAIKVAGALVKVGASQKWEVTTDESVAVGVVDEYQTTNGMLIFTLNQ